jgi:hypothetical protein
MAQRTLEEILVNLRQRVASLERRGVTGRHGGAVSPIRVMTWAAKSGPSAWISQYKNSWARFEGNGGSLDAGTDPNGILVLANGTYEIHAHQRGASASDYIGIGIGGSRDALELRAGGVWTHDHSPGGNGFANSYYMGPLVVGELITAGGPVAGGNIFGGSTTAGALYVRRIS